MRHTIFVIGAAQAGKSTLGRHLARALEGICHDTSHMILEQYARLTGHEIKSASEKARRRGDLVTIGNLMCSRRPGRLVELILDAHADLDCALIIPGIRRQTELLCATQEATKRGYCVHIVKVIRDLGITAVRDNYELHEVEVDFLIENVSTPAYLEKKAYEVANCVMREA
jgi:adenylate kinase family enzyme